MKLRLVLCVAMASAVLAMCFGMASYTNGSLASVSLPEDLIDAALETRGYPRLVLDSMNPKAKEAIYRNADLTFNAACVIVYDEETVEEVFGTKNPDELKEKIWQEVKKINKTMPAYKYVRDITVTNKELIKTTTQKVKRFEEIKTVL